MFGSCAHGSMRPTAAPGQTDHRRTGFAYRLPHGSWWTAARARATCTTPPNTFKYPTPHLYSPSRCYRHSVYALCHLRVLWLRSYQRLPSISPTPPAPTFFGTFIPHYRCKPGCGLFWDQPSAFVFSLPATPYHHHATSLALGAVERRAAGTRGLLHRRSAADSSTRFCLTTYRTNNQPSLNYCYAMVACTLHTVPRTPSLCLAYAVTLTVDDACTFHIHHTSPADYGYLVGIAVHAERNPADTT